MIYYRLLKRNLHTPHTIYGSNLINHRFKKWSISLQRFQIEKQTLMTSRAKKYKNDTLTKPRLGTQPYFRRNEKFETSAEKKTLFCQFYSVSFILSVLFCQFNSSLFQILGELRRVIEAGTRKTVGMGVKPTKTTCLASATVICHSHVL